MSGKTPIQWRDSSVNPVMGCSGCEPWDGGRKTCYAGRLHARRKGNVGFAPAFLTPKLFPGRTAAAAKWADLSGTSRPGKPWLDGLLRLVFASDMGDALGEKGAVGGDGEPVEGGGVPFDFLKQEIVDAALSEKGRRHRWLWLTKRPGRMARFCGRLRAGHGVDLPPNVWAGTPVTGRATLGRVNQLRDVGHELTTRFLSVEPLWEGVSPAGRLGGVRRVIVGGESSQGESAREFECEWARMLCDGCAAAGVAFFVKQLGTHATDGGVGLK